MLILTRRVGETLIINGNIEVQVMSVSGSQVRVGINAPRSVTVDRLEIHAKKIGELRQRLSAELRKKPVTA